MTRSKHKVHVGVCMWCTLELIRRSCNRDVTHDFYHAQFITIVKQMSNVKKVITLRIEQRTVLCYVTSFHGLCECCCCCCCCCCWFMYIMYRRPVSFKSVAAGVEFYHVHFLWYFHCFRSETSPLHALYELFKLMSNLNCKNFTQYMYQHFKHVLSPSCPDFSSEVLTN